VFSVKARREVATASGHSEPITAIKWIDERRFVTCSKDGSMVIWSL
jgi:WD40 repeat protein